MNLTAGPDFLSSALKRPQAPPEQHQGLAGIPNPSGSSPDVQAFS